MRQKFEDILDECLSLIAQGKGVEECLALYPAQAKELEPLLRLAQRSGRALGSPQPSSQAVAAGRERLLAALSRQHPPPRTSWLFLPRRLMPVLASLLAVAVLGTGTVMAASGSLPGESLYPVKMAAERARFAVTPSAAARARLLVRMADRRVEEISELEVEEAEEEEDEAGGEGKGAPPGLAEKRARVEEAQRRLKEHLARLAALAEQVDGNGAQKERLHQLMEQSLRRHQERLAALPPSPVPLQAEGIAPLAVPSPEPAPLPPRAEEVAPKGAPPPFAQAAGLRAAVQDYQKALERLEQLRQKMKEEQKAREEQKERQKQPPPRR